LCSAAQFGLSIGPQKKQVGGRRLLPPEIEYGARSTSVVKNGAWQVRMNQQQFFKPGQLTSFGVIIGPGKIVPRRVFSFLEGLFNEGRKLGMRLPRVPNHPAFFVSGGLRSSMQADFAEALAQANQASGPPELVFAFFDGVSDAYDLFKALGLESGLATQVLRWGKVLGSSDYQTKLNMLMKIK
jgi:hypothetical protein